MGHARRAAGAPTVGAIILGVVARLKRRTAAIVDAGARWTVGREMTPFAGLGQLDELIADCALSRGDLAALSQPMCGWAGRLLRMQERLWIEERLEVCDLVLIRDMDRVCRRCSAVKECETWLSAGVGDAGPSFCPNRPNFELL